MKQAVPRAKRIPRMFALALCFVGAAALGQSYPPPYPRHNAKEILQNDRVNVWDVTWPKGQPTAMHEHPFDQLSITLRGGTVRVTRLGGTPSEHDSTVGSVTLTPKGTIHMEEGLSDVPQHKVMLEVKPFSAGPLQLADGVRRAFPREGSVKLLENDRLIAWDFTWKPGQIVPLHAEDLDSVTVFLESGTIRSVTAQDDVKDTVRNAGEAVYSARNTETHTEEAVTGPVRAVIIQLK
jgi:quercetin dioxygenase-like cupin family protein